MSTNMTMRPLRRSPRGALAPRSAIAVLLAVVAGCSLGVAPEEGVELWPTAPEFDTTEPVTLTLTNGSSSNVSFSGCNHRLERLRGDAWRVVPQPRVECTLSLAAPVGPGETLGPFGIRRPDVRDVGSYRVAMDLLIHAGGSVRRIVSGSFQVR